MYKVRGADMVYVLFLSLAGGRSHYLCILRRFDEVVAA